MGYTVSLQKSDVVIIPEHEEEILARWKELNSPQYDHLKSGGQYGGPGGGKTKAWYSWMPEDYDQTAKCVTDVLDLLDFEYTDTEDGLLIDGYYSKTGQEDLFFAAIADLIPNGSTMYWAGEDGERWRWLFEDGILYSQEENEVTYAAGSPIQAPTLNIKEKEEEVKQLATDTSSIQAFEKPTRDETAIKAPSIEHLTTRPCSNEELQAALLHLITLHNELNDRINEFIVNGQIRSKRQVEDDKFNTPYGL